MINQLLVTTMKDQHEETFDLDYKGSLNPLNGKNTAV